MIHMLHMVCTGHVLHMVCMVHIMHIMRIVHHCAYGVYGAYEICGDLGWTSK
jgi:hypothetical protein